MTDDRIAPENTRRKRSRRVVLSSLSAAIVSGIAGCIGNGGKTNDESEHPENNTPSSVGLPTGNDSSLQENEEVLSEALENAEAELDAAYSEIHSANLVQPGSREWTPRVRDLGRLDLPVVKTHLSSAKNSLSEASNNLESSSDRHGTLEVLRQIAKLAEVGAEFYHTFALTFEKVYQYGFLIDEEGEHDLAVGKIERARKLLDDCEKFSEEISSNIQTLSDLFDESSGMRSLVPSFDLQKWEIIEEGLRKYPSILEARLIGFETYAEGRESDKRGVDEMIAGDYQNAQEKFVEARKSIDRAGIHFSSASGSFDHFFAERAATYENRVAGLDSGFLLHLRAANAYSRGETDKAGDLQLEGTTKILNTLKEHEMKN